MERAGERVGRGLTKEVMFYDVLLQLKRAMPFACTYDMLTGRGRWSILKSHALTNSLTWTTLAERRFNCSFRGWYGSRSVPAFLFEAHL